MPRILDTPPSSPPPTQRAQHSEALRLRRDHHTSDVIVVGAGILGCALAIALARQGRSVILLERSLKEPDRIVGELLQPGGVEALNKLGLRDCLENIDAIAVHGYVVYYHGEPVPVFYPEDIASPTTDAAAKPKEGEHEALLKGLKPQGRSFHHGRFVSSLRRACMREPNISIFETTAVSPVVSPYLPDTVLGVSCLANKEKDYFFAPLTVAADGSASNFRKELHPHVPMSKSKFFALELKDCALPYPNMGHVVLGDMPPILLYQIGTHETRILIDVPENCASAAPENGGVQNHLHTVVEKNLPLSVRPSFREALANDKLRSMPNSWLPPTTQGVKKNGIVLLGDAMNMRHPLTGGGMTVALNDVVLLAGLIKDVPVLDDRQRMAQVWSSFHWKRKGLTSVVNILAMALYSLFAADDSRLRALQRGCFRYFQFGGKCVDEPVGLLGGIIRRPIVLFYHFFSVALLSIWIAFTDSPAWKMPIFGFEAVAIFWKACVVIVPFICSELRS